MENILDDVLQKLQALNLLNIDVSMARKIINITINSVKNYILCEINHNIDFNQIKSIFIDIVIGEYLVLIKNASLDDNLNFDNAIKSISEGDVTISYFEKVDSDEQKINLLIKYFLNKKNLLLNFKTIRW